MARPSRRSWPPPERSRWGRWLVRGDRISGEPLPIRSCMCSMRRCSRCRWGSRANCTWAACNWRGAICSDLGEIEQALLEHPAVCEAVVVAQDDRAGGRQLVAYVVPAQQGDERVDWLQALRAFLQERLPDYMVPSHLLVLDSRPLTANGKVDRQALPPPQVDLEQGHKQDIQRRQGPIADL